MRHFYSGHFIEQGKSPELSTSLGGPRFGLDAVDRDSNSDTTVVQLYRLSYRGSSAWRGICSISTIIIITFYIYLLVLADRLCGLVIRVPGC
jgi:hypothetical protein